MLECKPISVNYAWIVNFLKMFVVVDVGTKVFYVAV
jgi:hypothetical protein